MEESLYNVMQNLSEEEKNEFKQFLEIVAGTMQKYGIIKSTFKRKKQKGKDLFTVNFMGINAKK